MGIERLVAAAVLAGLVASCGSENSSQQPQREGPMIMYVGPKAGSPEARKAALDQQSKRKVLPGSFYCGRNIAVVGDSLTVGTYANDLRWLCSRNTKVWDNATSPRSNFQVKGTDPYAAWGRHTGKMLTYFPQVLKGRMTKTDDGNVLMPPDVVIIMGGTNDIIVPDADIDRIYQNIEKMVSLAREAKVPSIVSTIPPYQNRHLRSGARYTTDGGVPYGFAIEHNIISFNNRIRTECTADAISDPYHALEDPDEQNAAHPLFFDSARIHYNSRGARIVAEDRHRALAVLAEKGMIRRR